MADEEQPVDLSKQPEEVVEDVAKGCFSSVIIFLGFIMICGVFAFFLLKVLLF